GPAGEAGMSGGQVRSRRSLTARVIRQLRRDKLALAALIIIVVYSAAAMLVYIGQIAERAHGLPDKQAANAWPSVSHPLGVNEEGRDGLSVELASTGVHKLIAGYREQRYTLGNRPPSWLMLLNGGWRQAVMPADLPEPASFSAEIRSATDPLTKYLRTRLT